MDNNFNFNLMSLNVRGIREYKKRRKLLNWLNNHGTKEGIAFLQETHGSPDIERDWRNQFRGEFFYSHGTSNSRGVAIVFGEKLEYKIISKYNDSEGRIIVINCTIQGEPFLLINTYAPNNERDQVIMMKKVARHVVEAGYPENAALVWATDHNFIFDEFLDAKGGSPSLKFKSIETMQTVMSDLDLCDIWRLRNPDARLYTWRGTGLGNPSGKKSKIHRRLDYFFVSDSLQPFIESTDIFLKIPKTLVPQAVTHGKFSAETFEQYLSNNFAQ